ncbi:MAG: hypothetical protein QG602_2010, partial [Verrucomicrobiota bacterium]|nr:hypothetical protein [Verrucomicrobiota bacterium]
MRSISITELHAETGSWVRAAKHETIVITRRGEKVAELIPLPDALRPQAKLN